MSINDGEFVIAAETLVRNARLGAVLGEKLRTVRLTGETEWTTLLRVLSLSEKVKCPKCWGACKDTKGKVCEECKGTGLKMAAPPRPPAEEPYKLVKEQGEEHWKIEFIFQSRPYSKSFPEEWMAKEYYNRVVTGQYSGKEKFACPKNMNGGRIYSYTDGASRYCRDCPREVQKACGRRD